MSQSSSGSAAFAKQAGLGLMLRSVTLITPLLQTDDTACHLAGWLAASAIQAYHPDSPADDLNTPARPRWRRLGQRR